MSVPSDYLILDIGTSWTKAFLISADVKPVIKASVKLPTSTENLRFSTGLAIEKIKGGSKDPKIILTSTYNEVSSLSKIFNATFVSKEQVTEELASWFTLQNFENPLVLDGGASNYLRNFRVSDVGVHLSFPINETDLENFIGNKTFKIQSIPDDKNQLEIEEAILRASFSVVPDLHNPAKFNTLIITGGILSWSPKPTRLALILLDLLSAEKVVQVLQDPLAYLYAFGSLINQKKSFKRVDFQLLKNLGSLVSLGGAGKVSLDYGLSEVQEVHISEDEIALIPASSSQKVELIIQGKNEKFRVSGGEFGIILDGRTKPLILEFGQEKTRQAVASWQQALDKVQLIEI